jgi:hypothetical protein
MACWTLDLLECSENSKDLCTTLVRNDLDPDTHNSDLTQNIDEDGMALSRGIVPISLAACLAPGKRAQKKSPRSESNLWAMICAAR